MVKRRLRTDFKSQKKRAEVEAHLKDWKITEWKVKDNDDPLFYPEFDAVIVEFEHPNGRTVSVVSRGEIDLCSTTEHYTNTTGKLTKTLYEEGELYANNWIEIEDSENEFDGSALMSISDAIDHALLAMGC